jgi:N-carbamoylputrescine amidase
LAGAADGLTPDSAGAPLPSSVVIGLPVSCASPSLAGGSTVRAVSELQPITALGAAPHFYSRVEQSTRPVLRVGAVQHRWHPDPGEHRAALAEGVRRAAEQGAALVCLQEQTLSPCFAITAERPRAAGAEPEPLPGGPTSAFAAELAREHGIHVHASLYERADDGDGLGFNTAIVMAPDGSLAARTRRRGPADADAFPVVELGEARFGFPTCWHRRFPELARAYAVAGAEIIVYPTAIGSGPDHPDFDTEPLWEKVIVANGIANGTFMVAINRIGAEPPLTFYGSSFISDPYGRVLVQAPRDEPAVLVADLDLDLGRRRDRPALFPSRSRPA